MTNQSHHPKLFGNRYEILDVIGEGGMGIVYRARDHLTGYDVALKQVTISNDQFVTSPHTGATMDNRLALAEEFQTLASLRHPHIISVLDYGFEDNQPYFSMELLDEAQTILVAGASCDVAGKIELIVQMLQALNYLHRRGIIHRDLKPENVLVVKGKVKLLDFGLAVPLNAEDDLSDKDKQVVGTLSYMAPEVLQGQKASLFSDLYGVGVIAYELLAGKYPYDSGSVASLIESIVHVVPDLSSLDLPDVSKTTLERLLKKKPEDRPRSAVELINLYAEATDNTVLREPEDVRESFLQGADFVGRDVELAQLTTAMSDAQLGNGAFWLVSGESGVGKSRLLEELRIRALVRGIQVVRGQTTKEVDIPYQLWRDVVRQLCLQTDLDDKEAGTLKAVIPDIDRLIGRDVLPVVQADDQKATQQALIEVIVGLFRRQSHPIMVMLEDLHWVSDDSIEVLQRLIDVLPKSSLFVVGSFRDEDRPDLINEILDKRPVETVHQLRLARFATTDIAELSVSMLGSDGVNNEIVSFIERESEGNVFFIIEVVRTLAEEAGQMQNITTMTLPLSIFADGIQTVIKRRLDRVSAKVLPLLEVAAIAGRELDVTLLQHLSQELDIQAWLLECAEIAVLEAREDKWRFAHDKLRDGVIDAMIDTHKVSIHRRIAGGLEDVYPDNPEHSPKLVYHWAAVGDQEKIAHYASIAGKHTLKGGAGRQARAYFEQALDALENLPDTPENQHRIIDNITKLSTIAVFYHVQGMEDRLEYACEIAEKLKDPELLMTTYNSQGTFNYAVGEMGKALKSLTRAIDVGEQHDLDHLPIVPYTGLGWVVMISGNLTKAIEMLSRGVDIAKKRNYTALYATCLLRYGYALALMGETEKALALMDEGIEIAQTLDEQEPFILGRLMRGTINCFLGRFTEAKAELEFCVGVGKQYNLDNLLFNAYGTLGSMLVQLGEFDKAEIILDRCLALSKQMDSAIGLPEFLARRAEVDLHRGNWESALAQAQVANETATKTHQHGIRIVVQRIIGKIYANATPPNFEQAETNIRKSIQQAEEQQARVFHVMGLLELGRLLIQQGQLDNARESLETAREMADKIGMTFPLRWINAELLKSSK